MVNKGVVEIFVLTKNTFKGEPESFRDGSAFGVEFSSVNLKAIDIVLFKSLSDKIFAA